MTARSVPFGMRIIPNGGSPLLTLSVPSMMKMITLLSGDGVQLVSVTHDFKFEAPDGKQRASDALDTKAACWILWSLER